MSCGDHGPPCQTARHRRPSGSRRVMPRKRIMDLDIDTYLARIGLARPAPTPAGLADLQQAQLQAIAFENLDPLLSRLPDLAPEALWRKLVASRRGGYCFELNGLFGMALTALGFAARPVLARVRMGASEGGARTHLGWIVSLDAGEWLADCGFGGPGPRLPLALDSGAEQDDGRDGFRIRLDPAAGERVVEKSTPGGWFSLYGFDDVAPRPVDIEAANVVCTRWERAPFGTNLMLSRQTPDGRVSLMNRAGRTDRDGGLEDPDAGLGQRSAPSARTRLRDRGRVRRRRSRLAAAARAGRRAEPLARPSAPGGLRHFGGEILFLLLDALADRDADEAGDLDTRVLGGLLDGDVGVHHELLVQQRDFLEELLHPAGDDVVLDHRFGLAAWSRWRFPQAPSGSGRCARARPAAGSSSASDSATGLVAAMCMAICLPMPASVPFSATSTPILPMPSAAALCT